MARLHFLFALLSLTTFLSAAEPEPNAGVFRAEKVEDSPRFTAAGMAWWRGRLMICDRASKSVIAHTPPYKFETFKTLTMPVGCVVDPAGNLVVTEKEKDVVQRLVRIKPDGSEETIVAGEPVGTPHFIAAHRNGTLYWSGFPDGGTRSLRPGGEVVIHTPRIGHTYGIALSPAQDFLYVASKLPNKDGRGVWRFPVNADGVAGKGEFFLQVQSLKPQLPNLPEPRDGDPTLLGWIGRLQGLAVDRLGYLYIAGAESHTSGEAVAVIHPSGQEVAAMILGVPRNISGLTFGGEDGRTLYITGAGEYPLHRVLLPVGR